MAISVKNLNHVYGKDTELVVHALKNINLEIIEGEFLGIIGHTGCGKSTLIQELNGLLKPTSGSVFYNGVDIADKSFKRKTLHSKVGLVFQYPEHQLFEVDVLSDVAFGPRNLGLSKEEAKERAKEALESVGIEEIYYTQSPFDLSGGQKRKVAIAGVLAMKPEVLILDEPTAGLDPKGRDEILDQVKKLKEESKMTVILVSHNMEDIANYVQRIIVMNQGEIVYDDTPKKIFENYKELEKIGLAAPKVTYIMNHLAREGFSVETNATTIKEAKEEILRKICKDRK